MIMTPCRLSIPFAAVTAALLAVAPGVAPALPIYSPVGGVINSGGPGFGLLSETYDQSGLLTNFVSGATDFESYIATNPMHTYLFSGNEWWSNAGISSASVTYDLGGVLSVSKLALWNEESAGIGSLDLWGSINDLDFFPLSLGLVPPDNQGDPPVDYGATVFSWAPTDLRYVRFDMSDCPQPQTTSTYSEYGCSIGV